MPAIDPIDQKAARDIELSLRDAVARRERPQVELDWLLALPKRIRRSGKLLEAAQAEARVLLEHVRSAWTRVANAEREREERLAHAKSQPRDLECLRAPDPTAWNGLGRRKKRCRTFDSIGPAFATRQRAPAPAPTTEPSVSDVQAIHHSSDHIPTRPNTPPGLREAAFGCVGLLASASGVNAYGHNSPYPMPPIPPRIVRCAPSPVPPPEPCLAYEGETVVDGQEVDWRVAYLVARGRWESCRSRPPPSLRQTAQEVLDAERLEPGVLGVLMELFFPHGMDDWSLARCRLIYLRDFVLGWYAVAP